MLFNTVLINYDRLTNGHCVFITEYFLLELKRCRWRCCRYQFILRFQISVSVSDNSELTLGKAPWNYTKHLNLVSMEKHFGETIVTKVRETEPKTRGQKPHPGEITFKPHGLFEEKKRFFPTCSTFNAISTPSAQITKRSIDAPPHKINITFTFHSNSSSFRRSFV